MLPRVHGNKIQPQAVYSSMGKCCSFVSALLATGGRSCLAQITPVHLHSRWLPSGPVRPQPRVAAFGSRPAEDWLRKTRLSNCSSQRRIKFEISSLSADLWVRSERFDIEAKPLGNPNADQVSEMLQVLLVDRFHLAAHHETKELPVYRLLKAKGGPEALALP